MNHPGFHSSYATWVQTYLPLKELLTHTNTMKRLLVFATIAAALLAFSPTTAKAEHYRSKRIGTCSQCNKSVYSYYRPARNSRGRTYYRWVPSYHSHCSSRNRSYYRGGSVFFFPGFWGGWGGGHHGGWGGHHGGWGGHHGGWGGGHGHGGHH